MNVNKTVEVEVSVNVTSDEILSAIQEADPLEVVRIIHVLFNGISNREIKLLRELAGAEAAGNVALEIEAFLERWKR